MSQTASLDAKSEKSRAGRNRTINKKKNNNYHRPQIFNCKKCGQDFRIGKSKHI